MPVWVVRVVEDVGKEAEAIRLGTCIAGWDTMPDFHTMGGLTTIKMALSKKFPAKNNSGLSGWASQIIAFRDAIQPGDLVVMPSKVDATLHVGVIAGPYECGRWQAPASARGGLAWQDAKERGARRSRLHRRLPERLQS